MNFIFTVSHLVLLFCVVFYAPCSEQKSTARAYQQLREKKVSDLIKSNGMSQSLASLFINPLNDLQSRQKATFENIFPEPCIDEIKFEKERLSNRVNFILDTIPQVDLLNYCSNPDDGLLEVYAMGIARNIVMKKNNLPPKKNETDQQYTERLLKAELKRFIIPTASHKVSQQPCVSSESPDIVVDEYYEYEEISRPQNINHESTFAKLFRQWGHFRCCVIQ